MKNLEPVVRKGLVPSILALAACTAPEDQLGLPPALPDKEWPPAHYYSYRAPAPIVVDGQVEGGEWDEAEWTEDFVDIEGDKKPLPRYRTRIKMLWDDEYLYIACELEEPNIWATLTERDSVIFHDNDIEVFIDPDGDTHSYGELEINALGTEWDLKLGKPYRDGGPAINEWNIEGLVSAVHLDGTLNDISDKDRGWTVEIALPWSGPRADQRLPPRSR